MPSPSDSSSVASMSGSRALSGSRRGMSGRTSARLLLYLGLCHLALGAMVLAFSFTSLAFTSSPRVRQSCPFWAGFFVSFFEYINTGMTCQQYAAVHHAIFNVLYLMFYYYKNDYACSICRLNEKLYGIFVLKEIVVPLGHLNNKYIINN